MDFITERRGDIEYRLSWELKPLTLGRDEQNGMHEQIACPQSLQLFYNIFLEFDDATPIVALLLGGNFTTLRALCRYLAQGTPVVVVQ
ncbi:unnamed protein product, partial [Rotaria sp. Silwood1]